MNIPLDSFLSEFESSFGKISDPRQAKKVEHPLMNILLIGFCSILCGAEGWKEMNLFGYAKRSFFENLLNLEKGIPDQNTFRRVFGLLEPSELSRCFTVWVRSSYGDIIPGDTLAIDGKALRGTQSKGVHKWVHLVHLWCEELGVCFGQQKVDTKSNEITAIPKLLKNFDITDCVVTIDAMGCQHEIAKQICAQKGYYILGLKGNQGDLLEQVQKICNTQKCDNQTTTVEKDHGRIETRTCEIFYDLTFLDLEKGWQEAGIQSIIKLSSTRDIKGKISTEVRYYICSYKPTAEIALRRIRNHWGVENKLHWQLDLSFREDNCKIKTNHAPENLAIFRKMALHLLKNGPYAKGGIKARSKRAGWDEEYLLDLILNLGYLS